MVVHFRGSGEPVRVNALLQSACVRLGPDPRRALSCLPGDYQEFASAQIFCTEKSIPKISNDAKIVCFSAVVMQRMSTLSPIQIRIVSWIRMVIEVVNRHVAQITNHQSGGNGGSDHEPGAPPQRSEYNY